MTWSFSIGRLLGSDVRVHATFLLLLAWIATAAYLQGGTGAAVTNTLFVIAIFACVVAHEFGHALAARRYGIVTPTITLLPIGGLAQLARMPEKPGAEVVVALAGPAVNIVIWAVLSVLIGTWADLGAILAFDQSGTGFFARLAALNLFLALFNMIPAFPMDGGRVLRALLSLRMPRLRATKIAAGLGQGVAFLFGYLGLTSGNIILLLIAVFIFLAAQAERSDTALRDTARDFSARDAMITNFESLRADDTLDNAGAALVRTTQHEFPVLDDDGRPIGLLTRKALYKGLSEEDGGAIPVRKRMAGDLPTMAPGAPLSDVLDALSGAGAEGAVMVEEAGRLAGYITRENVGELVVVARSDGAAPQGRARAS